MTSHSQLLFFLLSSQSLSWLILLFFSSSFDNCFSATFSHIFRLSLFTLLLVVIHPRLVGRIIRWNSHFEWKPLLFNSVGPLIMLRTNCLQLVHRLLYAIVLLLELFVLPLLLFTLVQRPCIHNCLVLDQIFITQLEQARLFSRRGKC